MEYESPAQSPSHGLGLDSHPETKCLLSKESLDIVSLESLSDLETLDEPTYGLGITNASCEYPKGRIMPSSLNFCLLRRWSGDWLTVVRS